MYETTAHIRDRLKSLYPPEEIRHFIRLIVSHVCGLSYNQQLLCKDRQFSEKQKKQIHLIVKRLKKMEPLQYVLGETEFYSLPLQVNPSVLIPRPETEELVDRVIRQSDASSALRILDIGTGSGCIAIALAKHLPKAAVTAVDISAPALQTARQNATLNQVDIHFIQADILKTEVAMKQIDGAFDIIVSNPPYVLDAEKQTMSANVLDYEPHCALFVPDNDPLLFYKAIVDFALQKLTPTGRIYFEINPACDEQIKNLLHNKGFKEAILLRDLSGKMRFAQAKSPTFT
jgi:release factor glutamine methyltransferase